MSTTQFETSMSIFSVGCSYTNDGFSKETKTYLLINPCTIITVANITVD